jgi:hypothetical protein
VIDMTELRTVNKSCIYICINTNDLQTSTKPLYPNKDESPSVGQAVIRRFLNADARVQSYASLCGIYSE